ncbi:short-chain dehydrogenase-like protein, partial [Dinothrombium tinctorium]
GVRVNSVNPGVVKTPASEPYFEDPKFLEEAQNFSVFHRVAEPEEIAKTVAFLASNTSSFVTGTNLIVDG